MYGKEKALCSANRRYQADGSGTQGGSGKGPQDTKGQKPKEDDGPQEQLLRDAKTQTEKQSDHAQALAKRIGLKENKVAQPQHPARDANKRD